MPASDAFRSSSSYLAIFAVVCSSSVRKSLSLARPTSPAVACSSSAAVADATDCVNRSVDADAWSPSSPQNVMNSITSATPPIKAVRCSASCATPVPSAPITYVVPCIIGFKRFTSAPASSKTSPNNPPSESANAPTGGPTIRVSAPPSSCNASNSDCAPATISCIGSGNVETSFVPTRTTSRNSDNTRAASVTVGRNRSPIAALVRSIEFWSVSITTI